MYYQTPILETERLVLHRGSKEDYQRVYEYDFTKLRDIGGECEFVKTNPSDIEDFDTYADEFEEVYDWIIYLKDTNIPIGNITADREIKEIHSTELAFNLHPSYWGKGYMKEALIEVMNYLYQNGFDNIVYGYSEGNRKSKRLNEKMGFVPYKMESNAWSKDGIAITDYKTIMSREKFYSLYLEYLHTTKKTNNTSIIRKNI